MPSPPIPMTHRCAFLPDYSSGELRHLAATEDVVHLDDILLRRTSIAFIGAATAEALAEVADAIAPVLGWDADRAGGRGRPRPRPGPRRGPHVVPGVRAIA